MTVPGVQGAASHAAWAGKLPLLVDFQGGSYEGPLLKTNELRSPKLPAFAPIAEAGRQWVYSLPLLASRSGNIAIQRYGIA